MGSAAERVQLDDDDFLRHEKRVATSVERGVADLEAGRTRTSDEVLALLEEQRIARRGE